MDAASQERRRGIINQAVAGEGREPGELAGDNVHGEMRAIPGAGMAGVVGAVVAQRKGRRRERLAQQRFQLAGQGAHALSLPVTCSQTICPIRNTNMVTIRPMLLIFTQVASGAW